VRWNAIYLMITRALYLRDALDLYASKLRGSIEELDKETFKYDFLTPKEWKALELIRD
jgi:hypothetical protein